MPVIADRRPHQAPVQHPPEAEAPEDRSRPGLRLRGAAHRHRTRSRTATRALGIIHQTWSPVPGRIKDFIAMPRPNGYQSLHTSVISERGVPVRGADPHRRDAPRRPRKGSRRTGSTRKGGVGAGRDEQYFLWLRQLLEWQQEVRDPQEFLQNLKIELYPEEVYIFTPKGEVKSLPARRHAGGLRLLDPHRRRPPVRRRARQRQDGAAAHPAAQRRHRRDHHHAGAQAEPRLAELRRHLARARTRSSTSSTRRRRSAASSSDGSCSRRRRSRYGLNLKSLTEPDDA